MKAIIPAAGYGTRLRPLTSYIPKALIDINGRPVIEYVLDKIAELNCVDSLYIITNNYYYTQFCRWLDALDKKRYDFKIEIINDGTNNENERLGAIGDKVLAINGTEINDWQAIKTSLFIENSSAEKEVSVLRDSNKSSFAISLELLGKASQEQYFLPLAEVSPVISTVIKDSPANDAGIEPGDIFLSINSSNIKSTAETIKIISSNPDTELSLTILREEDTVLTAVTPGIDGKIGISLKDSYTGIIEYEEYSFFAAIGSGFGMSVQYVSVTLDYMSRVILGKLEVAQAFGGPVKIAQIATESADAGVIPYLGFLAMLSLSLAILNILPFPVLDGGHFVIILIEGIMRREIPIKIKIAVQNAGFILLLMLMAFIIYNDIINF